MVSGKTGMQIQDGTTKRERFGRFVGLAALLFALNAVVLTVGEFGYAMFHSASFREYLDFKSFGSPFEFPIGTSCVLGGFFGITGLLLSRERRCAALGMVGSAVMLGSAILVEFAQPDPEGLALNLLQETTTTVVYTTEVTADDDLAELNKKLAEQDKAEMQDTSQPTQPDLR